MSDRLNNLLEQGTAALEQAGVPSPRNDAQLLLAHAHQVDRAELIKALVMCTGFVGAQGDPQQLEEAEELYLELIVQRAKRIPLQHLTGTAPFRDFEVKVGAGVFVPRPETELVAQAGIDGIGQILAQAPDQGEDCGELLAVDLCTGSGVIAISLARETNAQVHAVELDQEAHRWAQQNIAALAPGVQLHRADARTALSDLDAQVHAVISNPPYIPPDAVPQDPEVHEHDPHQALYGLGPDGLAIPAGIVAAAARLLRPGGIFVMEHAQVQGAQVRELVAANGGFERIETRQDLTGRDRMVVAWRKQIGEPQR